MATTLKDIAKVAGVSESTVSRCLNDSKSVSAATKARIKKIAEEMDFQFNINAQNLAKKRSKRIGIIFPDGYYRFNMSHFFSNLEEYLVRYVEEKGYEAVIYTLNKRNKKSSNLKKLINGREVDGLLIACRDVPEEDVDSIRKKKLPYVFVYYKPSRVWGEMNLYTSDNIYSGYLATRYLIDNGCKKIATVTSSDKHLKNYSERTRGYIKAMKEAGLPMEKRYIMKEEVDFKVGESLALREGDLFREIDGIFCQQDKLALGLMKGLVSMGYDIPGDISIIGHDDMEIIDYFDPKLTSISQPFDSICKNAVMSLFNQVDGVEKNLRKIFRSSVVERDTVKNY